MTDTTRAFFLEQAANFDLVPVTRRILSDFLTPVLAYRRLVSADQRTDTSFLLESVETGGRVGRYSILAAGPSMELTARGGSVHCIEHASGKELVRTDADPIALMRDMTSNLRIAPEPPGQRPFCGGWAGRAMTVSGDWNLRHCRSKGPRQRIVTCLIFIWLDMTLLLSLIMWTKPLN